MEKTYDEMTRTEQEAAYVERMVLRLGETRRADLIEYVKDTYYLGFDINITTQIAGCNVADDPRVLAAAAECGAEMTPAGWYSVEADAAQPLNDVLDAIRAESKIVRAPKSGSDYAEFHQSDNDDGESNR